MLKLIGNRLLATIPLLLIVSVMVFSIVHLVPGDPAITILGENSTPERVAETRERLGLDDPILEQYGRWLSGAVRGDLGTSLFTSEPVSEALADRIPITLSLTAVSLVVAMLIGVTAGIVAAAKRGTFIDRLATLGASLGVAVPNYWLGSILIVTLALGRDWFPATGYTPPSESVVDWLRGLFLPAIALGSAAAAEIARQLRASLVDVLQQDYIRTARAKGMGRWLVIGKHGLKNAAMPLVTVIGFQVTVLLGGSVIVEQIFGIPGLGSLAVRKVLEQDIPVVQGIVLVSVLIVVIVNLLVDITYGWLNPKVRA